MKTNDVYLFVLSFYFVGGVVHNERIFMFGGPINKWCSAQVYNPKTDRWTCIASMIKSRHCFGVGVIKDHIYLVGGFFGPQWTTTKRY